MRKALGRLEQILPADDVPSLASLPLNSQFANLSMESSRIANPRSSQVWEGRTPVVPEEER